MATRRNTEDENVNEASLERVIALLEPTEGKPITKKEACGILCIAYNTTRLGALIEKFKEKKAKDAARRAALRGKPATTDEIIFAISEYLGGATIDSISKSTFRGPAFIHGILQNASVPVRASGNNYFNPELIPESAVRSSYRIGEVVWSSRYDSLARVDLEFKTKDGENGYRIWLMDERWLQCANQPASELASLEHLREIGVKI